MPTYALLLAEISASFWILEIYVVELIFLEQNKGLTFYEAFFFFFSPFKNVLHGKGLVCLDVERTSKSILIFIEKKTVEKIL